MDTDFHSEDEMPADEPICASCGVALIRHLGHQGICAHLLAARAALSKIVDASAPDRKGDEVWEIAVEGLKASE